MFVPLVVEFDKSGLVFLFTLNASCKAETRQAEGKTETNTNVIPIH